MGVSNVLVLQYYLSQHLVAKFITVRMVVVRSCSCSCDCGMFR
jgi:hypothetical protein